MKKIDAVYQFLVNFLQGVCLMLVIGLTVMVFFKVFFRYVLNNPIVWSDEVILILMLCLTYFGAALAAHRGGHINVEIIETLLGGKQSRGGSMVRRINDIITVLLLTVVMYFGVKLSLYSRDQQTDLLLLSYFWIYIILPIGLFFMILLIIKKIMDEWKA